jgi:hypothetical protein
MELEKKLSQFYSKMNMEKDNSILKMSAEKRKQMYIQLKRQEEERRKKDEEEKKKLLGIS